MALFLAHTIFAVPTRFNPYQSVSIQIPALVTPDASDARAVLKIAPILIIV